MQAKQIMPDPDISQSSPAARQVTPLDPLPIAHDVARTVIERPDLASEALRGRKRQAILHGPVLPTLLRLGLPTIGVLLAQNVVAVAETYWTGFLGKEALAGVALVFPRWR